MKLGLILPSAAACLLIAGCATNREDGTAERAGKGAAVGAAVGAAAGAIIGGVSPVQGAVAGAVVGGAAKAASRKDRRYFRDENGECYYLTKGGGRVYDPAGCATVIER